MGVVTGDWVEEEKLYSYQNFCSLRAAAIPHSPLPPSPLKTLSNIEFDTEEGLGPKRLVHASIWHFIRAFSALYLVDLIW